MGKTPSKNTILYQRNERRNNNMNETLDKELGKTFSRLFEIRHSSDYDDFAYCDQSVPDQYTPKAKDFVNSVKNLIDED